MASEFDPKKIEGKWLKKWEKAKIFDSNPDGRKRFYLTVAYPYPSGGMHIGHARTYTVPDVIARFKRMQGYNVLFPMGWHVTGTPIIGALNRMKEGEEKQMKVLKEVYSMTDDDIKSIAEPIDFARYFIKNHYRDGMKRLGYTVDWRRQFTTNDKHYNRFIEWQYKTLHKRGLLKEGLHPVKYCTKDKNPVTTHDLLEGESADVQEFTLLKFKFGDAFIVAATLRPETVFGQTNMWVGPDIEYVKAKIGGETWIISEECAKKLKLQDRDIEVIGKIKGRELLGKHCVAPGIDREIIILPSEFCDPDIGSGMVTCVPSDAPYDWMGLKDLQENKELCERYGLNYEDIRTIEVIPIITTEEFGDMAALKICEAMGIKSQKETKKLEEATQIVYKTGFHTGSLNENCGKYKGMAVVRAKEKVKQELLEEGKADVMLEFSEPVRCRCGGKVVVAKAESWFVDYGNEDWKEVTDACIRELNTIPEKTKQEYLNTVEWLHEWPCIRNFGLGTRLPLDDRFMIEPLSDSTIYMAFYTISHLIGEKDAEKLEPEFFDFIFRNEGTIDDVSLKTGMKKARLQEIKKSFDYWYPQDWRCSALELIQNHLTFMLYHHTALFPRDKWPRGIATFGMGLLEGEKMSSSRGNVVLVKSAIDRHGADVIRLFLMSNAEPWQDFDWRENIVESTARKLKQFFNLVSGSLENKGTSDKRPIDDWLLSRIHGAARLASESLEGFQTRKALQILFYGLLNDVSWYTRRADPNPKVFRDFCNIWVRLLTPFIPFACEELWEKVGGGGFVSNAEWPRADEKLINPRIEAGEMLIQDVISDVKNILDVTKKTPKKIHLYLSEDWKYDVFDAVTSGKTIKDVMGDPKLRKHGKQVAKLMQTRRDGIPEILLTPKEELKVLSDAKDFLGRQFNCTFEVPKKPDFDPENKARHALPMKPGIFVE